MISNNFSFKDMEPICWQIWAEIRTPELACKMIELAFCHGSSHDITHLFTELKKYPVLYYPHIDKEIRFHIAHKLWREEKTAPSFKSCCCSESY